MSFKDISKLAQEKRQKEANERVKEISGQINTILIDNRVTALEAEIILSQMINLYNQAAKSDYIIYDREKKDV